MIYGYDEAQLFPVQSLYDTGMINMYLNAVKGEYERGIADQKEFISKYGDFISPFSKDVEAWDKATLGGYRDLVNNLRQQGIDPIRSQEGRAAIQNFILSRPYGDLAKLKQSAETGKKYLDRVADLAAHGLYNPDMAKQTDGDFQNWDTLGGSGIWTTAAPAKYETIQEMVDPTVKQLKSAFRKLRKEPGYDVFGVTDDQVRGALNNSFVDLMNKPSMQYAFKKSGLSEDEFKELLFQQVKDETPEDYKKDEVWFLNEQQKFTERTNRLKNEATIAAARIRKGQNPMENSMHYLDLSKATAEANYIKAAQNVMQSKGDDKALAQMNSMIASGDRRAPEAAWRYLRKNGYFKEGNDQFGFSKDSASGFYSRMGRFPDKETTVKTTSDTDQTKQQGSSESGNNKNVQAQTSTDQIKAGVTTVGTTKGIKITKEEYQNLMTPYQFRQLRNTGVVPQSKVSTKTSYETVSDKNGERVVKKPVTTRNIPKYEDIISVEGTNGESAIGNYFQAGNLGQASKVVVHYYETRNGKRQKAQVTLFYDHGSNYGSGSDTWAVQTDAAYDKAAGIKYKTTQSETLWTSDED